jgi:hypothetical protein
MLAIEPLMADRATRNRNYDKPDKHGRCLICEAPINPSRALAFAVHGGGSHIVTLDEYAAMEQTDPAAGLGTQYIGRDCYRKHQGVLAPYRIRGRESR